jgi:hypothetical protein
MLQTRIEVAGAGYIGCGVLDSVVIDNDVEILSVDIVCRPYQGFSWAD